MAGQGPIDASTGIDYEESEHSGRVVRIASVAALGGLLFGYDSAVINGAVSAVEDHFQISKFVTGVAVAAALIGAALGAVVAGRLADKIGRLSVMKIAALLFLISAFGTGLAPNVWIFGLFRVVGGIGVGVASVIAPAYIAETSPPRIRGRLGSLQQLAIVTGIFVSLAVDALLAHLAGGSRGELWLGLQAWRWMFIIMAVPAILYGTLAFTIPESPRYLVATYRIPEARKVLSMLLGEKNLELTITRIKESLKSEKPPSWSDLRKPTGGLYGIVWVGVGLSVFQQFVGINVIFYYSNVLWQAVGFDESQSFIITVITSVTNIVTTLIAIALIDKIGRKPLLLIGSIGMAVTLGTMAVIFGTAPVIDGQPHLEGAAGTIALVAANLFVVAFGMSWGPVVWVDCQLSDHGVLPEAG
jgi:sugar porter (SP) family MFS transporter